MQSTVRDMTSMDTSIGIAPAKPFPPTAPMRIAASPNHLEGRRNPHSFSRRVVALAFRDLGCETACLAERINSRAKYRKRTSSISESFVLSFVSLKVWKVSLALARQALSLSRDEIMRAPRLPR